MEVPWHISVGSFGKSELKRVCKNLEEKLYSGLWTLITTHYKIISESIVSASSNLTYCIAREKSILLQKCHIVNIHDFPDLEIAISTGFQWRTRNI